MRAVLPGLLLVLTGCTTPVQEDAPRLCASYEPMGAPGPCEVTRPLVAGCARLGVELEPAQALAGEDVRVRVRLTNLCAEEFEVQSTDGCQRHGMSAAIVVNGTRYSIVDGTAQERRVCSASVSPARVVPADGDVVGEFAWNGILEDSDCADACQPWRPEPEHYVVEAWVNRHPEVSADTTLEVVAGASPTLGEAR